METPRPALRSADGFLLIEVIASLMILAIGLGGLVPLLVGSMRGVDQGRRTTAAAALAVDEMEAIRNTAYAAVASGNDTVTQSDSGTQYTRTWTVAAGPTTGTKLVTIAVQWTCHGSQTVTVQTIVGQ